MKWPPSTVTARHCLVQRVARPMFATSNVSAAIRCCTVAGFCRLSEALYERVLDGLPKRPNCEERTFPRQQPRQISAHLGAFFVHFGAQPNFSNLSTTKLIMNL
jgi:hypothetical protein